jgi:DNA invertase Pin-like site-specific DNA recombinase
MNKQPNNGITALYERLSKDDEQKNESVSIANQKQILEDYARKNGFQNIRHFTDDGVRGTTFKRPGLDAMLEEIKAGNVATVIIKDQSRIGRVVVEVGLLKRTFDEYNVRFIAANDNLDTANGFDIMSIFRDVINEWYVADTSRKIKAVFKSRMEKGLRCSGSIPYGYLAGKENTTEWIIDPEAAPIVRRIFQSIIDGQGLHDIGRALRAEQIPIPSAHWERIGAPVRAAGYADPYAWSATTIGGIIQRPEYMGRMVLGKTVCENYKTKNNRKTAPEEQFIFDGAIPAIVDEETWNNAQRLRKTVRRPPKREGAPHRLTGLLYCADCGAKLTHRSGLVQKKWVDDSFICSSYRQLTRDCLMHYIPSKKMEAAILTAIQRVSWYVQHNEKEFIQRVREASTVQQEETVKDCKRRLSQSKKRHDELDGLVKKLYEANATGKLTDRHFERLMSEYDDEQTGLEAAMNDLQGQIDAWSEDKLKTDKFIELVKRYTDFTELTTPMLNEFIEKVMVYEGEGRGNSRRQRLDIFMNFIGAFEVPAHIVTPMELEERRLIQEKEAAKKQRAKEYAQSRGEIVNQKNREFAARKAAGLLTPEEAEADRIRLERNRIVHNEWREKRNAALPPKPPKPPSAKSVLQDIVSRKNADMPLAPEENEIYQAYRDKENEKARERRERIKASQPPKPPKEKKPTKKEVIACIIERKNAGLTLTREEQTAYELHRESRNAMHKKWRDAKAADKPQKLYITEIQKRIKEGLELSPEEAATYDSWREKKSEYQRGWREKNSGYMQEWQAKKKVNAALPMAANQ